MSKSYSSKLSKTCGGCGQLYFEDDSNCICPPEFEDWFRDLSNDKEIELANQFYADKIGPLFIDQSSAHRELYELSKDAEAFMIDSIRELKIFESEWNSFLKEIHQEEVEL